MQTSKKKLFKQHDGKVWYWCGACDFPHALDHKWTINTDTATISPSVLSMGEYRCHHYVRNGQIQYLSDCDHGHQNTTVDMLESSNWPRGWGKVWEGEEE